MKIIRLLQTILVLFVICFSCTVIFNIFFHAEIPYLPAANASVDKEPLLPTQDKINSVDQISSLDQSKEKQLIVLNGAIKAGESFDVSLHRLKILFPVRKVIIDSFRDHLDFRRLSPKDSYTVKFRQDGSLHSCIYQAGPLESYSLTTNTGTVTVKKDAIELENKTVRIGSTIESSLYMAFSRINEGISLLHGFADIFGSKIDFNTEPRPGDRFEIIVDKYYRNGHFVGYGKIKMAKYIQVSGRELAGYYYSSGPENGVYYDQDGKEVGTSFIRSPVTMGRVSSRFTYRRKHPITGKIQPHLGIDLAAPVGTPIMAAADGKVISIGRNRGYGRQVIISHFGGYKTYYGHLLKYKKGLKRGSMVNKKEIIGYVGSSGVSTGPHLDYRITHHSTYKDPFSVKFKPKSELQGANLDYFNSFICQLNDSIRLVPENDNHFVLQVTTFTLEPEQKLVLL